MKHDIKICLFNPIPVNSYPPLNLTYLASYLRKYGKYDYEFKLVDSNFSNSPVEEIVAFQPNIIGFTSLSSYSLEIYETARIIRAEYPKSLLICGGVHATINPAEVLKEGGFDIAVVGEGEETFKEVVDTYIEGQRRISPDRLSRIRGIAYRANSEVHINPPRDLIEDLDSVPHPARELLNNRAYHNHSFLTRGINTFGVYTIVGSRGCPYHCIFCCVNFTTQGKVRHHSPLYIADEVEELITKYHAHWLFFTDDTFFINKEQTRQLCQLMIRRGFHKKIKWEVQIRSNLIKEEDLELLQLMKLAGCRQIDIGFESANQRVLTLIKGGTITVSDHQNAIDLANRAGIKVMGSFIIGTPTETYQEMLETKSFIERNFAKLHRFQVCCATPYPGTRLYEMCVEKGLISQNYLEELHWEKEHKIEAMLRVFSDLVDKDTVLKLRMELDNLSFRKIRLTEKIKWFFFNLVKNRKVLLDGIRWVISRLFYRKHIERSNT